MFEKYTIPPPKLSFVDSIRSGNLNILADISVHKPTATKSDRTAPSPKGVISKQATSTSNVVCLQKSNVF